MNKGYLFSVIQAGRKGLKVGWGIIYPSPPVMIGLRYGPIRSPTGPLLKRWNESHPFPYRALVRSLELRVVSTPIAQRPVANKGHAAYVPTGLGKTYGREDFGLPGWI